ncbi:MAG: LAGLIDADG endonuclease [Candidatus Nanoarchaeia archaeon]
MSETSLEKKEYSAASIRVLKGLETPSERRKRIATLFPNLHKSKVDTLSHFKLSKELELFSKSYNVFELQVRQLRKAIKEWGVLLEKNPFILLNQLQHDLIIGGLIGDANARKRWGLTHFRCSHSAKQKDYLVWKYNKFRDFVGSDISVKQRKNREKEYSFATLSRPIFNYYHNLFYENGRKKITREILELLNPMSLAIWICDDGNYGTKQDYIILCTNSFTHEEHLLMKQYFKEKWGLDPTIGFRDNKYYYLRFKKEDTLKLVSIIQNFVPVKQMMYKIGERND